VSEGATREALAVALRRWDDIVVRWRLDPAERKALVGGPGRIAGDEQTAYRLICGEQRIRLLVDVDAVLLRALGTDAAVRDWLRTSALDFGGRTPIVVLAASPEWMIWLLDRFGGTRS